jgi:hypothetical protein
MQHSHRPYEELERAKAAVQEMLAATDLNGFEEHWKQYLHRLERTWSKLAGHFSKSPKWHGWCSPFEHQRRVDPLLAYLVNARGAEEHTVNDVVGRNPGGIGINPASGNRICIERLEQREGKIYIQADQSLKIDFIPAKTKLIPVVNRGRTYPVPRMHLGSAINPEDVPALAQTGIAYYSEILASAERFFVTNPAG